VGGNEAMRVLIDTSFILPAFGVDVGEKISDLIKDFGKHYIYFSELSLIESMWVIRRLIKRGENVDEKLVRVGLKSVLETYKLVKVPVSAYISAVKDRRHEDLIDLILFYTAKSYNMKFLTLDERVKELDSENVVIDGL
jgi:predicted nucleic acid-binding protein